MKKNIAHTTFSFSRDAPNHPKSATVVLGRSIILLTLLLVQQGLCLEYNAVNGIISPPPGADTSSEMSPHDSHLSKPLHDTPICESETWQKSVLFCQGPLMKSASEISILCDQYQLEKSEEVSLSGSTESDYAIETYYNELTIPVLIILGSLYIKSLF